MTGQTHCRALGAGGPVAIRALIPPRNRRFAHVQLTAMCDDSLAQRRKENKSNLLVICHIDSFAHSADYRVLDEFFVERRKNCDSRWTGTMS
ncbi:hypothetical protein AVEN_259994-1 [Araneus ventricosus]|uniref:Uncharacterized protein n=1 Tax=Araneus ventricosus TaxID=182803 RepID=A0A4Y2U7K9_ARAVE|nr:hypothetical protein AVEN_259994-1 [Araneus ventricosus]